MKIIVYVFLGFLLTLLLQKFQTRGVRQLRASDAYDMLLNKKKVVFLDIRTDNEIKKGAIRKAKTGYDFFNKSQFIDKISTLNKNVPYVIYCASGTRSLRAYKLMKKNGFSDLYSLKGGYFSWARQNYP